MANTPAGSIACFEVSDGVTTTSTRVPSFKGMGLEGLSTPFSYVALIAIVMTVELLVSFSSYLACSPEIGAHEIEFDLDAEELIPKRLLCIATRNGKD